ncbi:MAG TPA: ComF family protein [Gammaproteobacteria bacterium]|nr:ComF family protein [Gammaproteobacteria bacterium]
MALVNNWLNRLQSVLFPQTCRLCLAPTGTQDFALCAACRDELPWLPRTCSGCALPLPEDSSATRCARCQQSPPYLDRCQALFSYRAPVDQWIQDAKFRQDLTATRLLGALLAQRVAAPESQPVKLLPVPLHRKRLRVRGYNQALEIARPLVRKGYVPAPTQCRKHRATAAQSDLPADRRRHNVRGAFSVTRPLSGERFLLVDDVLTTGATLNELARTLKRAGAQRVEAWVIARTIGRNFGDG